MPTSFYTGGHALGDIVRELRAQFGSLPKAQDALARQLIDGEIVSTPPLPQGWYLKETKSYGDGIRARYRVMLVTPGEWQDVNETPYRCHYSHREPGLPDPNGAVPPAKEVPSEAAANSAADPEPALMPQLTQGPDWLEEITPCFEDIVRQKGRFQSLGDLREAVKEELKSRKRTYPGDRTIERMLNRHRSHWFNKDGA